MVVEQTAGVEITAELKTAVTRLDGGHLLNPFGRIGGSRLSGLRLGSLRILRLGGRRGGGNGRFLGHHNRVLLCHCRRGEH